MKLPHDREHLIHLCCGPRVPAPVPPAEGDLGNLLARAEAVIHGTAAEALPPEIGVNAAPEVRLQMGTRPAGLSIAKSADAENAGATQHSPKQRPQSARSTWCARSGASPEGPGSLLKGGLRPERRRFAVRLRPGLRSSWRAELAVARIGPITTASSRGGEIGARS